MQKFIEVKRGDLLIRGVIHVPENIDDNIPVVIMAHGFTGTNTEFGFSFVELSRKLEKEGIASVRFDFIGSGISDGEFIDMTLTSEIEDLKSIINYIKTLEYINKDKIALLGMSQGGVVSGMVAAIKREDIKALCLWSPAACITDNLKDGHIQGVSIDEKAKMDGYVDVKGFKVGMNYIEDALRYDFYEISKDFDKNVLLVYGSEDFIVPEKYIKGYLDYYKDRAEIVKVEGANHCYEKVEQKDELIESTINFLMKELK